jgi:hypothetical protein
MTYVPRSFHIGVAVSLLSAAALAVLARANRVRNSRFRELSRAVWDPGA